MTKSVRLIDVYNNLNPLTYEILYRLLSERKPYQNISHKKMPTFRNHVKFVDSKPYKQWNLIKGYDTRYSVLNDLGAVYLSHNNEIGLFIFDEYANKGYGKVSLKEFIAKYPQKEYLANINPLNESSIRFFEKNKFVYYRTQLDECTQNTYKFVNPVF